MSDVDAYRPFVPRRGRAMAFTAAALSVVVFGIVAFVLVPGGGATGWTTMDKWSLFFLGCAIGWMLSRWGLVKAVPNERGLKVRNLILTREIEWAEILGVQFGGGRAWATLDLADTEQLAVMAIQRADGPSAEAEASRLAALVEVARQRAAAAAGAHD
ncbi:PH domain-containing protein [Dermacoccus nishinomiyaensis]|uniref:PH domain-containing protein n=1 Tax=Dermacoccus TaxID=57495 RepID=UPI0001E64213|nr:MULTISPECIES: PH domain-containing protein [Dermacoccus]EFP59174.1 hypothetical protein HMPREF0321_1916 [Dermacoccus sp. Ellin185]MBO1757355.1 PH domain-containing protein [Dermacoccus sp. NHGro5]MCT1603279.1 PH domain-containing protein [Dermacoccus nishinomiyaensis]QQY23713.1 PH domain-containing protein [Dermacoccus nishinomiyaensis]TCJ91829.1 PH (Pleckstrin Homology) domain-containing protein [Dermacoccus sp. SAI-028]